MIISELNHLEVVAEAASVEGGWLSYPTYYEKDVIEVNFTSNNNFKTKAELHPHFSYNSAAAGAKADAVNNTYWLTDSYTKADTVSVAYFGGGSISASTSAAIIKPMGY